MPKCYQCEKPAMFLVTDKSIPLCLECNLRFVQLTTTQNDMLERQINYLSDQMGVMVGLPPMGPRFPERKTVNVEGITLHNIKVDNSTVGVINTGNIQTVDVAVSALEQDGHGNIAGALNALTSAVLESSEIQAQSKNEIVELLSLISSEATAPKEKRRKSVVKLLLEHLQKLLSVTKQAGELWEKWGGAISGWFGI